MSRASWQEGEAPGGEGKAEFGRHGDGGAVGRDLSADIASNTEEKAVMDVQVAKEGHRRKDKGRRKEKKNKDSDDDTNNSADSSGMATGAEKVQVQSS
ncbi:hypothetical protein E2562_010271 [Oryza meyeriana var. granulata]|uniref:Uncharacterized protein n=1 Tax=Oryza meyeriana var. granulata TaxID=110450 RepID=A0A6G1EIV3_9ORYZ|nr:hypothetical protein E2562_010271 [Oryza meyeriana var. granulata]